MPETTFDIIEISFNSRHAGQRVRNITHFLKVADYPTTVEDFYGQVLTLYAGTVHSEVAHAVTLDSLTWRNLFNASDMGEVVLSTPLHGGRPEVNEALPPHDTFSIALLHNEPSIRNGRKSITGVCEENTTDGIITSAQLLRVTDEALLFFTNDVTWGDGGSLVAVLRPIVVKRIAEIIDGQTRYRLPANASEALVGIIFDIIVDVYVRTQNSRKIGRGE